MTFRVAVLDDYQGVARASADFSALDARAEVSVFHDHLHDQDSVVERLAPFDAVIAMRERTPFGRDLVDRLTRLRLLVTTGMANASFDMATLAERGITVCGTRMVGSATPELTWSLVLAVTRGLAAEDAAVRAGRWQVGIGPEIAGSTIGILGLGRVGSRVAHYAHAFDAEVIAWSTNLTAERAAEAGARLVDREGLFRESSVVVVCVKLSERTRGLVGTRELELLGPAGYLVNTSRGPIVDEAALVKALQKRRIAGAALDVFDTEPLPNDHPLLGLDNVVLSPHLGYVSQEGYRVFYREAVEDVLSWLDGTPVRVLGA
jgi:phosphoglycerate dehydrogenase-like enzyme